MELVVATRNPKKWKEIADLLRDLPITVRPMSEFPSIPDVEETGKSFEENAILKAKTVAEATGRLTLADDSGLVVPALNGAPGIYSARYAGLGATDTDNNQKLVRALRDKSEDERKAYYVCVIALATPQGETYVTYGECHGVLALTPRGTGGFGYDPFFHLPDREVRMAELSSEEKAQVSHRGHALRKMKKYLSERFG